MIIAPIIPIWIMAVICIAIILIIFFKPRKKVNKEKKINYCIKILIVILLFTINLRPMIPNEETTILSSNTKILFVIDKSVSMRALDYNAGKERFEGVINDCNYILDELSTCKFSIITFSDSAKVIIPFTDDLDMVKAELESITLDNDFYATGSSINNVKDKMEKILKNAYEKQENNSETIVFFITDGEITIDGEKLNSFSELKQYINNGAIMGYGTTDGGKMVSSTYADKPDSPFYYISYLDENTKRVPALSKLDENNLKQLSNDMGIDYIQMSKQNNIKYKLNEIKQQIASKQSNEEKIDTYKDTYFYFAIPLAILFILDFILKKRRM